MNDCDFRRGYPNKQEGQKIKSDFLNLNILTIEVKQELKLRGDEIDFITLRGILQKRNVISPYPLFHTLTDSEKKHLINAIIIDLKKSQ